MNAVNQRGKREREGGNFKSGRLPLFPDTCHVWLPDTVFYDAVYVFIVILCLFGINHCIQYIKFAYLHFAC